MHRRLISLVSTARLSMTITVLSGFLIAVLAVVQAWLLSHTINGAFLERQTLAQVGIWMLLILAVIAVRGILVFINDVSANGLAVRIKTELREQLFHHIQQLGPAFTRGERTGELTTVMTEGIEALDAYYSQYLPQLAMAALVPIAILFFVFPIDLLSGIIMLVTAPLIPFFMILIGRAAEALTHRQFNSLSRMSAHFLDSLQGLTTLKLFGRSKTHSRIIARVNDRYRDATLQILRTTFLSALVLELLSTLSTAIIAVEIGLRLLYTSIEFQTAFFLLLLAPEFYLPLRMLGARFHAGMAGTSAARSIFAILDTPIKSDPSSGCKLPSLLSSDRLNDKIPSIVFENVSFTYPNGTGPALQNINLSITSGRHIAIVGRTGSGKSTLASLLLGFISPSCGRIVNQAGRLLSKDELRRNIAWVGQTPHLFHDSLAANLRLAKPVASENEIIEASKAGYLHEFVLTLPGRYETCIGEGGARLSAGQAQRLTLARAFLKNAPILILDEPTSNLDPETEFVLERSTRRLMQARTVITIAHRLNTVRHADQIIVLDSGRIVDTGTHLELVARQGIYASMVSMCNGRHVEVADSKEAKPAITQELRLDEPSTPVSSPPSLNNTKPRILFRLSSFLNGSWSYVGLSVLLASLTTGSSVALMGTSAWLISMAALHPSIAELSLAIVGVRFFGISRAVFRYLERLVSHNVTLRLLTRLRVWFFESLEPLAPARLMHYRAGDILARIVSDINELENFYVRIFMPHLAALVIGTAVFIYMIPYNLNFAIIQIAGFVGVGVILPQLFLRLSRGIGESLARQRGHLNALLVDGIQGLADILVFDADSTYAHKVSRLAREYSGSQSRLAHLSALNSTGGMILTNLTVWLLIWFAIPLVRAGQIPGVLLGALALISLASFEALQPLPLAAQFWGTTQEAARRLFEVVDVTPEVSEMDEKPVLGALHKKYNPNKTLTAAIEFSNLSFNYPGNQQPALQDISFSVPRGRSLAIVGPSGAGKTSLVNLLLRFWDYSTGDILLNGISIKRYDPASVRNQIGVITQNDYFFNTSILENLKLAKPDAKEEDIQMAARRVQIHDMISVLPKGYDTSIDEQGQKLSVGERQRLGLARVFLRDRPIVILDEPTANLDALTEAEILANLIEVLRSKTVILITHRLIGLDRMDEILVMEHARIVERGTHQRLLAVGGLYSRMMDLQNSIFTDTCP